MGKSSVGVSLDSSEMTALIAMSKADCRPLAEQLRFLLRIAAQQRGLLPQPTEHTNGAPTPLTAEGAARG